ncbi:Fatty acid desaturase, type 1 [Arthroderma uncinatum]|uniref:Fatty acid desaturase, type 1 n=1 Tax=Arthroderma uncinatum TaxID=74035 RepID=UPI00144AA9E7|nr:Fatty acid desaturase, type 1 [Arthroderma uncinatum]KAF3490578.1 Fatty acid desaturase, type 1 [Arthroderma uncinatum]
MGKQSVLGELRAFRATIPQEKLRVWENPTGWPCLLKIARDWALILAAYQLFARFPSSPTFIAALLLMSWGQRGLSTLAHDSIHGNLYKNKWINDLVTNVFLAPALMSTAKLQRASHSAHHNYLGTEDDPDHGEHNPTSLRHYRTGTYCHKSMFSLFLYDVMDPVLFLHSALGDLKAAPVLLIGWWAAVGLLTSFLEPSYPLLSLGNIRINTFVVLFHFVRCTISYGFYVLREIIDHSGLPSNGVLEFTRSSPWGSWFQKFLQPHDDNYHLLHHLLPKVPMSKLHVADSWLMKNNEEYAKANHFDTYLEDHKSLFLQQLHSCANE